MIRTTFQFKHNYTLYFYDEQYSKTFEYYCFEINLRDVTILECINETHKIMCKHQFAEADIVDSYTGEVLFSFTAE